MAAEHATLMVLKVDLECSSCFLKVKKVLGNLPQIGDQVFDWKKNEVTISVICCNPHKIRDKLRSKAGKAIKSVKIKEPAKPKAAEKPKELVKKVPFVEPKSIAKSDKLKTDEKPVIKPTKSDPSKTPLKPSVNQVLELVKMPAPVNGYPLQVYPSDVPFATYSGQCYDGGLGHHGPFGHGHEYGYGGSRAVNVSRLDYLSEENPSGCSIM